MSVARRVIVHGLVQGVFFRDTTRREARRRGVAGWVRNLDDGTLEAWFEGEPDAIDALLAFAGQGPPGARVDRVEVHTVEPAGEHGFRVRGG